MNPSKVLADIQPESYFVALDESGHVPLFCQVRQIEGDSVLAHVVNGEYLIGFSKSTGRSTTGRDPEREFTATFTEADLGRFKDDYNAAFAYAGIRLAGEPEPKVRTRRDAERLINDVLWPVDTPEGRRFLDEVIERRGLAALTDEAVIELARAQDAYEERRGASPARPPGM
jgi:hypothetical protein